jgi:vitamin B12 transporter
MALARTLLALAFTGCATLLLAAPDASPVIDVTANRLDSNSYTSPYGELSVAEQAASIPGVRLLRQGLGSPQADLRIRGGAFSSSGFALEGLALFNPQTEHFHADLPIVPLMTESPRLLTGMEQFRQMSGHASGTVAMDLAVPEDYAKFDLTAGSEGFFAPAAALGWNRPAESGATRGGAVFAQHDQIDQTDGYTDNDLSRWSAGALLQHSDAGQRALGSLLGAFSTKRFGARGFYGAPASLASEEEVSSSLILGSLRSLNAAEPARLSAAWQHGDDRYWLDRHDRDLYYNHHRTDDLALHADTAPRLSPEWALPLRADVNGERIDSEYRGRIPSTGLGSHSRNRLALGAVPEWTGGTLTVTAGGAGEWFDTDKPAWLPAAGVRWKAAPGHALFAAVTTAVRQPSYTELNYDSPGSLGNNDLKRQESVRSEAGWHFENARDRLGAMLFQDDARRVVDWVRGDAAARWTAVNLGQVRTRGILLHGSRKIGDRFSLNAEYLGLDKKSDDPVFASRYALDYARHDVRAGIRFDPVANWRIGLWQTAAFYRENPARTGSDTDWESNLEGQWRLSRLGMILSAGVANVWDHDFQTLPGQPPADRRAYLSASITL